MTEFFFDISCGVEEHSLFDAKLIVKWQNIQDKGLMRYTIRSPFSQKVKELQTKDVSIIAQLSIERATNRRLPERILDIDQPFDESRFNFTKIKADEVISKFDDVHLIVNASPVDFGSSLVVPQLDLCLPQRITTLGLKATLDVVLQSKSWCMRAGFNSLTAYASVNHQHFHIYYLSHHLGIETALADPLIPDLVYQLKDWPAKGFAFQLSKRDQMEKFVDDVMKLVNYLQRNRIAHNMFITRGTQFDSNEKNPHRYTVIRLFLWAREPVFGAKETDGFNPALCELAGHILVKDEASFNTITSEEVASILSTVTEKEFETVKTALSRIFQ